MFSDEHNAAKRETSLVRLREHFARHGATELDLSGYHRQGDTIRYRCRCGRNAEVAWNSRFDRTVRCSRCFAEDVGQRTQDKFDIVNRVRAKCEENGAAFIEGSYRTNAVPFRFVCACGRGAQRRWMDVQAYEHSKVRCAQCWQDARPRGETHHWYDPDRDPEQRAEDRSSECPGYFTWESTVLRRANWTCCLSGKRGGDMSAHHVRWYSRWPELRTDLDNGVCVRAKLHALFHYSYHFSATPDEVAAWAEFSRRYRAGEFASLVG